MIIDCHGHYTTEPKDLLRWRKEQVDHLKDPAKQPSKALLKVSDDEIRESLEGAQLKLQRERGTDLTIFSPRAMGMSHHIGDYNVSLAWSQLCNEMIHRVCTLYPSNFVGVCQLPQSPGVSPDSCIGELERCVKEFGFVGCNLNPDPSGGYWTAPPLTDRWWYKFYEKMVMGDLFKDFPTLKLIIPHGGGAVPFHWGRYRGLAINNKRPPLDEMMKNNVWFDTCVYHQPGIDLLTKVVPIDNILFASEMVGAVRGKDPQTGYDFDDTKRYVDGAPGLSAEDKKKIFESNVLRAYPRLKSKLSARTAARS